ncbi:ribonuclease H-like domain-containing protein [Candidatus Woesearchaeota archaeon]|nr:ribonuclease H-like domain-containing protein [Candidatus Woesearchaeota archaeon]
MIRNSFVLLDRIGLGKEREIWASGVDGWNSFLAAKQVKHIGARSKGYYDRQLLKAKKQLLADNAQYFSSKLPLSEHWRLYDYFRDDTVFLDIETTGLGRGDEITVVGLYDGNDTKTMIKGINLDYKRLAEELKKYKLLITFNGSSFDVPFLSRSMKLPDTPHFDLRFACRRVGLRGGLKSIERQLGIERSNSIVASLNGGDAAELWRMYRGSGDEYYLNLLVEYNEEDIVNLKRLAEHVYSGLKQKIYI